MPYNDWLLFLLMMYRTREDWPDLTSLFKSQFIISNLFLENAAKLLNCSNENTVHKNTLSTYGKSPQLQSCLFVKSPMKNKSETLSCLQCYNEC